MGSSQYSVSLTDLTQLINQITMVGFIGTLLPHLYLLFRNGFGMAHEPIPRWVPIWFSLSLLTYMILDNLDGKQARKTGNSSTLGSLFDHGCDVTNLILSSTSVLEMVGATNLEFYCLFGTLLISFSVPLVEQLLQ